MPRSRPWTVPLLAGTGWVMLNLAALMLGRSGLPFDWVRGEGRSVADRLVDANVALFEVGLLTVIVYLLTRRRPAPDVAARAPDRDLALRETLALLAYGACGLAGGFVLARALGWHPFGWHLAGTLYGTHSHVEPVEAICWSAYNLVVYAVVPYVYFRRRYTARALNLVSSDRRNDALVIIVVLLVESVVQYAAIRPSTFGLPAVALPLTFLLYFAGAVLPAMVFIYAILVPRFLRLTGSVPATVLLGGLTYAAGHVWDAWTVLDSPGNALLSLVFLLLTYFGPGMFKTVLTLRTGNAWVHVWGYHAFAPHTLADTPNIAEIFKLR